MTGVAAAGGKILARYVSGDSMLKFFFMRFQATDFLGDFKLKFFLQEISSNRYVYDFLHGIFMGFYAPV